MAHSPYPRENYAPPVAIAGRIVWPNLVYDPTTGRSTPTPAAVRKVMEKLDGSDPHGAVPSMHILGDKVTLAGYAFDPVTATLTPLPSKPRAAGLTTGQAWAGGPGGILSFGGLLATGVANTTTNISVRLLPRS